MADPIPSYRRHIDHVREDGGYSGTIVYANDDKGNAVELTVCTSCHYIFAKCEHTTNTWDKDGEHLTCDLCGIDGT